MKIIEVKSLEISEIKVVRFERFSDDRGYFTETSRNTDIFENPQTGFLKKNEFKQMNESFSKKGVIRGLHFQWNPYMGKMVRTISGHMIDLVLDIRKGSPYFGKSVAYDMPSNSANDFGEWIWVPPGFAHGNLFVDNTIIEYFCTGEYSPGCESCISPFAEDIDWSFCDSALKNQFELIRQGLHIITEKDKNGLTVSAWESDPNSNNFIYGSI